jgi:hypothetical protein
MDYQIGTVTLHSQDKNRMLDFLSDVLEFNIDQENNFVSHGAFIFQLYEGALLKKNSDPGLEFNFFVKSEEELQEILRKYHFFLYRKPAATALKEKIRFTDENQKKTLIIEDIDRRLWRFELSAKINDL